MVFIQQETTEIPSTSQHTEGNEVFTFLIPVHKVLKDLFPHLLFLLFLVLLPALASLGCRNQIALAEQLKQQKFVLSQI